MGCFREAGSADPGFDGSTVKSRGMTTSPAEGPTGGRSQPRAAAVTMARDEADMLPRWVQYYGGQFGVDNLLVIDDGSVDGSTENLPCQRYRLPAGPTKLPWVAMRRKLVNGFARALLACYDVVVFSDVDEFLVPDPRRYDGLLDYVNKTGDRSVVAPLAVNVLHDARLEPALDPEQPVLAQRSLVKFVPGMCKPLIKRVPADWSAGLHGISAPFEIDRDLLLVHLKYYDTAFLAAVARQRRAVNEQDDRGGAASAWTLSAEELASRLRSWVELPAGEEVEEFDPSEPDLSAVVSAHDSGFYRSVGSQLSAMEESPLRRLPQHWRNAL